MSTDLFSDIPEARAEDVPVKRSRGRQKALITKLGSTAKEDQPRKKTDFNPIQQRWFRKHGWTFQRVEVANAWGAVNQDMWKCIDYLMCRAGDGIVLVQVTSETNISSHFKKIKDAPEIPEWLKSGGKVELHIWRQPGGKGTEWLLRRIRIVLDGDTLTREEGTL